MKGSLSEFLRSVLAGGAAARVPVDQDEARDAFGSGGGQTDRDGGGLERRDDRKPVEPRRVGHGDHVGHMYVQVVLGPDRIRQTGASDVVADQATPVGEGGQGGAVQAARPVLFEMREVVPGVEDGRPVPGARPGDAGAVRRGGVADRLTKRGGGRGRGIRLDGDGGDHLEAAARDRADDPLVAAGVADGVARGVDPRADRGLRDDPPLPDRLDEPVFGHEGAGVLGQQVQDVEDLGLDGDRLAAPGQDVASEVQPGVAEDVDQAGAPLKNLSAPQP